MSRRHITIAVAVLAVVFFGVMTRALLDTTGSDGAAWKLGTPADLELAGRPQLVEFFHPL
jgi:hypothetical protein